MGDEMEQVHYSSLYGWFFFFVVLIFEDQK